MSQTNGHTANGAGHSPDLSELVPDLQRLQQQLAILRTEHEIATFSQELREATDPNYGSGGWGSIVDPYEMQNWVSRYGDLWMPTGNSRANRMDGANRPFVWTDFDLDRTRDLARWLATKNEMCIGAMESLADYTTRTGFTYEAKPGKKFAKDATATALAALVEDVIDEFMDLNAWGGREWDACYRLHRDGEVFIRCFRQDDGRTIVRNVEPEQVRQPAGESHAWTYGCYTPHGDVENVTAYAVDYGNQAEWDPVPAEEMSHLKTNVDTCVKRGLSDLFCVGDSLDEVKKLLRNMRQGAAIQAAIAWYEMHKGADAAAVQAKVQGQRDRNRPFIQNPITGRDVNYQKFEPGSVVSKGGGVEILPAPSATNVSPHVQVVQAALRAIATRWRMTESMISGDASNNNMASQLIAGSPFVTRVEARQHLKFKPFFLRTIWIAIRNAAAAGRFVIAGHIYDWQEISRLVDIHATPPKVAIANRAEEWTIDNGLVTAGAMSLQTLCARHDLDPDQERANLREWPLTRVGGGVTDIDPSGNPVEPADPNAEPGEDADPSEAGGSPFAGLGMESRDPLFARVRQLREQYGEALAGEIASVAERLLEGSPVPNKGQPGHFHDSETGKPVANPNQHGEPGGKPTGQPGSAPKIQPSKATVETGKGKEKEVAELSNTLLGEHAQHIASLVGAPDDAKVYLHPTTDGKGLEIVTKGNGVESGRYLRRNKAGQLFIKNDMIEVAKEKQGSGIGSDIFAKQVATASALGVAYIRCDAAKAKDQNGYYTWPRMGYDLPIAEIKDEKAKTAISAAFPAAQSVLDIMSTPAGRDWWKANGVQLDGAKFDLTPGSRSMQIHAAYMAERAGRKNA